VATAKRSKSKPSPRTTLVDEEVDVSRVGRVIMRVRRRLHYDDALAAVTGFKGGLTRHQDEDQERKPR
jgi:hypothetical protein